MPQTVIIESRGEFEQRHGGAAGWPVVYVGEGTWILESGAKIRHSDRIDREDFLFEPPAGAGERLRARLRYHGTRLAMLTDVFHKIRRAELREGRFEWTADLTQNFGFVPTNWPDGPVDGETDLKRLRDECKRHKEIIAKLEIEVSELPETIERQKRRQKRLEEQREFNAAVREADRKVRERIERIKID